jgi:hypothetical protein
VVIARSRARTFRRPLQTDIVQDEYTAECIQYFIDPAQNVIWTVVHGDLSGGLLRHAAAMTTSDADYRPSMDVYVDCRVVTTVPEEQSVRAIAIERVLWKRSVPVGRVAIVVMTRLGLQWADAIELYSDAPHPDVAVFTSPAPALAWLSLSSEPPKIVDSGMTRSDDI